MRGLGTLINLATVAVGGTVGVFMGDRLPERIRVTIMQGLGLVVIAVAVTGLEPLLDPDAGLRRFVILTVGMISGGIIGEALRLEERLENLGERLKRRFGVTEQHAHEPPGTHSSFAEGFVIASTVFCVGPLTILGAIQDGLGVSVRLLAIKSALDGFAAIGFASIYGAGVLASLLTVAVYQGGMTLAAALVEPLMTTEVLAELGATGSLLILGIGLRLLEIKQIAVLNLLPAVVVAPLLAGIFATIWL
jgi:uncharacterized membrane protein YqgA involved in biofilm formation